jgi:hypothetical protein
MLRAVNTTYLCCAAPFDLPGLGGFSSGFISSRPWIFNADPWTGLTGFSRTGALDVVLYDLPGPHT